MESYVSSSPYKLPSLDFPNTVELLLAKATEWGRDKGRVQMEDGHSGEKRYYKNYSEETDRVANYLYNKGFRQGDIVIYMTSHQIHLVVLMGAVWRCNGILRSLYADEADETILEKVTESEVKWMFCDAENASTCKRVLEKVPWNVEIVVCGPQMEGYQSFYNLLAFEDPIDRPPTTVKLEDIALILPTSGTTGSSKGAVHTHRSLMSTVLTFTKFPFTHPKPNLLASKGTHVSGATIILTTIVRGVTAIVLPKTNKEILIRTVDKYKPGFVFAFSSFLVALPTVEAKGYDMTSVEVIFSGGSPVTPEMIKSLMTLPNLKAVLIGYGLTECPAVSTTVSFEKDYMTKPAAEGCPLGSAGKPFTEVNIQIRDLTSLEPLGPNQEGQICYKGRCSFQEYYKNPEMTKNAFKDGWFLTGDVGYLDKDGNLFLVDRQKDIFKYFHNHISPTEIENVVLSSHPEVQEACVFPIPDEGGEVPRVLVTLKDPNKINPAELSLMAQEIKNAANAKLASYKQLRGGLYIVSELPKGKTGKVMRTLAAQVELPHEG